MQEDAIPNKAEQPGRKEHSSQPTDGRISDSSGRGRRGALSFRILAGPEGHGDEERNGVTLTRRHTQALLPPRATWEASGAAGATWGSPGKSQRPQLALTLSHPLGAAWDVAVAQSHSRNSSPETQESPLPQALLVGGA